MVKGLMFVVVALAVYAIKAPYEHRVFLTIGIIGILAYIRFGAKRR